MDKKKSVLVIMQDDEMSVYAKSVLDSSNYRVISASTNNEAKLKFSNEIFDMLIIDIGLMTISSLEFVRSVRRKESLKNLRDNIPILIISNDSAQFVKDFSEFDNINFISSPFTELEFKKKLFTFADNANIISSNTKKIKKDEYLITEGGGSFEMFWVLAGSFMITKLNRDNNEVMISKISTGELVGEMSFLDSLPRSASVRALEDSEVLVIPHKKFLHVLDGQPRWFRALMQTMSQRLRDANTRITQKSMLDNIDND